MMSRRWLGVLTPQGKPSLADFSFQVFNVFPSPEQDDQNAHLSRGYSAARDQARPRRSMWIVVSTQHIKISSLDLIERVPSGAEPRPVAARHPRTPPPRTPHPLVANPQCLRSACHRRRSTMSTLRRRRRASVARSLSRSLMRVRRPRRALMRLLGVAPWPTTSPWAADMMLQNLDVLRRFPPR